MLLYRLFRRENIKLRKIGNQSILVPAKRIQEMQNNHIYYLNDLGTLIWENINECFSVNIEHSFCFSDKPINFEFSKLINIILKQCSLCQTNEIENDISEFINNLFYSGLVYIEIFEL